MKKLLLLSTFALLLGQTILAQDAKPKPSPLAKATETIVSGATITIDYSQPAVKGRTIGTNLEPMAGKVWRTGANDATVFETSKDVMVQGQKLAAGKYGLFSVVNNGEWTIIFNKTFKQWGAFQYKEADDALRVKAKADKAPEFHEKMSFEIAKSGDITLFWGDHRVVFQVK
ncbi:MAG: hypothetical protein B7Y15_11370 [Bacteroidetes bacterium 24-39-8]|jgi:hypothetical protein|nr:MAG: hypothetical protein B7Y69_10130 [Sphingobacteriia bacterium 35-40-8]OYZ48783.1 MAG: hypothetical protein B7Y15_11370 [Bacteroidetes bacterium 24-39-8]OZA66864.1 MAG: hypothetical protein B7X72_04825 [Sphingobacteriia bacterium 39-39-8]HQR93108.1 DUF2911 domain-containing protein [Sediminibacterium sp.]HQS56147.1 DUF2911 domain-containing protein [Sediminibacterium sp.]